MNVATVGPTAHRLDDPLVTVRITDSARPTHKLRIVLEFNFIP